MAAGMSAVLGLVSRRVGEIMIDTMIANILANAPGLLGTHTHAQLNEADSKKAETKPYHKTGLGQIILLTVPQY
jgi:hypothetical protein